MEFRILIPDILLPEKSQKECSLRRLVLNVVLNAVLSVVPGIESCSVWHLNPGLQGLHVPLDIKNELSYFLLKNAHQNLHKILIAIFTVLS